MGYARLLAWEVYNFMSVEHGKCEFDDRNIINIKGYNDSGKSAMLRALDVLLFNSYSKEQVQFIKDDTEYFRVVAYFEDGVQILRDKYLNGQSLYEMYKDNECVYSTKVGGSLQKISKVPEPIEKYLGVVQYLNSRTCYQKQLLVQTSGSENYKMCNEILRSEEIASAGTMLNNDKNKLLADINSTDAQLQAYKEVVSDGDKFTEELIESMELKDKLIDTLGGRSSILKDINTDVLSINTLVVYPELDNLSTKRVSEIQGIVDTVLSRENLGVDIPEIKSLDTGRLNTLDTLGGILEERNTLGMDTPELHAIDSSRVKSLEDLKNLLGVSIDIAPMLNDIDILRLDILRTIKDMQDSLPDIDALDTEISSIQLELKSYAGNGVKICPNCGTLV